MADALIALSYGAVTLAALVLSILSKRPLLERLGWLMMAAWVLCNLVTIFVGFTRAPLLIPMIDTMLALCVPMIAGRSSVGAVVFGLFVAVAIVHVDAFLTHTQGTPPYYITLNALFLLQVVAVGGVSGLACLADRRAPIGLGAGLYPGGARMDAEER